MALTKVQQTIWSARLLENLFVQSIYMGLCNRNYESDASNANKVKIHSLSGAITVSDYSADTDINDPVLLTDTEQEMPLDQQKYFAFYVDDLDRTQSRPELMDAAMRRAAIAISAVQDQYIVNLISAATVAAKVSSQATRNSVNVLAELSKGVTTLRKASVPNDQAKWVTLQPDDMAAFEDGVTNQAAEANLSMFVPGTAEQVLRGGYAGNYKGARLHMTNRRVTSGNIQNTGAAKSEIIFGTQSGITFASQIAEIESYRPEKRFGTVVKGLYVYAARVTDPSQFAGAKIG